MSKNLYLSIKLEVRLNSAMERRSSRAKILSASL